MQCELCGKTIETRFCDVCEDSYKYQAANWGDDE